jgi:hypothetical protein
VIAWQTFWWVGGAKRFVCRCRLLEDGKDKKPTIFPESLIYISSSHPCGEKLSYNCCITLPLKSQQKSHIHMLDMRLNLPRVEKWMFKVPDNEHLHLLCNYLIPLTDESGVHDHCNRQTTKLNMFLCVCNIFEWCVKIIIFKKNCEKIAAYWTHLCSKEHNVIRNKDIFCYSNILLTCVMICNKQNQHTDPKWRHMLIPHHGLILLFDLLD